MDEHKKIQKPIGNSSPLRTDSYSICSRMGSTRYSHPPTSKEPGQVHFVEEERLQEGPVSLE